MSPDAVRSLPILRPVEGHAHQVPFFLTREMFGGLPFELAGGDISQLVDRPVADAHVHACDEIYLLIAPAPGAAVIDVELDGELHSFASPAAVFVPAGVRHRFVTRRATTGSYCFGIFVPRQTAAVPPPGPGADPG